MAYNIFIDSDIILDVLLQRLPFFENSVSLFEAEVNGIIRLYTSPSIILNVQYFSQKVIGKLKAIELIQRLLKHVEICITTKEHLTKAYHSSFSDVEDAVQYYSAASEKLMDYFVTRNVKDYARADEHLNVITPKEAVKILSETS